jgi:xanthine dehydrogenase FAD-binding subunit
MLKYSINGSVVVADTYRGGVGTKARRKVPPSMWFLSPRLLWIYIGLEHHSTGRRSMSLWKNYFLAHSIPEALEQLSSASNGVRLVAGGTDLLLELQQAIGLPVDTLIDVTGIPELLALEVRGDQLFVGAAVPITRIVNSPLVQYHVPALAEACELIGGPQVRNSATLGGNVAHALPAADGTIALLAYDALAEAEGISGSRLEPVQDLFLGPRRSQIEIRREILVGFYLPLRVASVGSAFRRVMRPQGVALPIMNAAVWIRRQGEVISDVRVAIGPTGPTPVRARGTENMLRGQSYEESLVDRAYQTLIDEVQIRTSKHRATSDYRRHLVRVLLDECLKVAWERSWDGSGRGNDRDIISH